MANAVVQKARVYAFSPPWKANLESEIVTAHAKAAIAEKMKPLDIFISSMCYLITQIQTRSRFFPQKRASIGITRWGFRGDS